MMCKYLSTSCFYKLRYATQQPRSAQQENFNRGKSDELPMSLYQNIYYVNKHTLTTKCHKKPNPFFERALAFASNPQQ